MLEARVGFEPTDGGFADLSLRPLGYRAVLISITEAASRELLQSVARVSELPLLYCRYCERRPLNEFVDRMARGLAACCKRR
jgi:hypothetical protein